MIEEEDIYTYRPLPWMSKSTVISEKFCPYLFFLRYIRGMDIGVSLAAKTGVNMHMVCEKFFEKIDIPALERIPIIYNEQIENSRVFNFMLNTAMELIPIESRKYITYQNILTNFALIEAVHWIELNRRFEENREKVLKYFIPMYLEKYVEAKNVLLYGTLDRKNRVLDGKREVFEIYDYKTGHVPRSVTRGLQYSDNEFSWDLPSDKMFELHFYVLLDILNRGFTLAPEIINYLMLPQFFTKDSPLPKLAYYFYDKHGVGYKFQKDYRVGIIYLNGDIPYVPKKLAGKRSMGAVFRRINSLRGKMYRKEPFLKQPNYYICRNCSISDKCLSEQEMELLGLGRDNPTTNV